MMRLAILPVAATIGLLAIPAANAEQPDAELVGLAVNQIYAGVPFEEIEGMPEVDESKLSAINSLQGCAPSVAEGSSADFVRIAFLCERSENLPTERVVIFVFEGSELQRIAVTLLPTAIGPTPTALEAENTGMPRKVFGSFVKAVRKGEDPRLGEIVPLGPEQLVQLNSMQACSWQKTSSTNRNKHHAFVTCRKMEGRPQFMVTMNFDDKERPKSVEIDYGKRLVVDTFAG